MTLPNSIEDTNEGVIREQIRAMLRTLEPQWGGSRTDPLSALIEVWAAREYGNRERANVRMRRNMLPYATGLDLDVIGEMLTVARRPDETDASYRVRLSDQFAANSPAVGNLSWYRSNVMDAFVQVFDVNVIIESNKDTSVYVLAHATERDDTEGIPNDVLLAAIQELLDRPDKKAVTDTIIVSAPANLFKFNIVATVGLDGVREEDAKNLLEDELKDFNEDAFRLGRTWHYSEIVARMHNVIGVTSVSLGSGTSPDAQTVTNAQAIGTKPVSYTHLTLPTILLV